MPLDYQQLKISDFSGGITDKYVNSAPNEHKELTNYYVNEIGKPELVQGYGVVYDSEVQSRIMGIFELNDTLLVNRFEQMYVFNTGANTLTKVDPVNVSTPLFKYYGPTSYPNAIEWQDQLVVTNTGQSSPTVQYNRPRIIYRDAINNLQAFEAGLPYIENNFDVTPQDPDVTYGYIYAYHYSYEYTVGDTLYRSVGPVNFADRVTNEFKVSPGSPMSIINVDTLGITEAGTQYDLANIKLEIYRTIANGDVYYKLPSDGNPLNLQGEYTLNALPVGTRLDLVEDDSLQTQAVIYNQESPTRASAPKCKYITVSNDAVYYMNCAEEVQDADTLTVSTFTRPYRLYQSVPGNPTNIDPSAFVDLDDELKGGGSLNGVTIAMTKSKIYRIEGQLDGAGNGTIRSKVISDTAGCVSHRSIIVANDRMYWCGNNGFYVTDGFNVILLTPRLLNSYGIITDNEARSERITATYYDREQRIIFATSDNDVENNEWWIFNIKAGTAFTKARGEAMNTSAVFAYNRKIYRGDELGYLYEHSDEYFTHLRRDSTIPASDWLRIHIPYRLETQSIDLGNNAVKKWGREATITYKTDTNQAILPVSNNDDEESVRDMKEIRRFSGWIWRDENVLWLDPEIQWRNAETQSRQRHFPRGQSRFRTKSVALEPAKTILYNSDWWGECLVEFVNPANPSDLKLTLSGTDVWPENILADTITFEDDDYLAEYQIKTRTDQILTTVGGAVSLGAGKKWQVKGYAKEVEQEVKDITITYAFMDNVGDRFDKSEEGGNG
jgi:hypothetical protein